MALYQHITHESYSSGCIPSLVWYSLLYWIVSIKVAEARQGSLQPRIQPLCNSIFFDSVSATWQERNEMMKTRCCMSLFNIRERDREDVHLQSQSANTMQGFFPPSSRVTLFRLLLAAASLINWPTCTHDSKQQYLTPSWGNYTKKQKKKPLPLPYTKKQRCECKADDLMMGISF